MKYQLEGRGGSLAPELSFEGSQVKKDWLISYLEKPYAIRPFLVERMPRFNLTDSERKTISDYVSLVWRNDMIDNLSAPVTGDPIEGEQLYALNGCQFCHTIGTNGGYYGPALDTVARRLKPAWILARLENAHKYSEDAKEPVLAISANDRQDLLAYLMTLKGEKTQ